jgi:di/tricarboxylate transporter
MVTEAYTLIVLTLLIVGLVVDKIRPSYTFVLAVILLVVGGVVPSSQFLAALANPAILTIFLLIIITAGINNHFPISRYLDKLLGNTTSPRIFSLRFGFFVSTLSAVMNNTPVVAMLMPYIHNWGKTKGISPSKLLIPLSFFAISGGMITLIGTSTNLVLLGLVNEHSQEPLLFTDFLIPGLAVAMLTILFMVTVGYKLLPNNKDLIAIFKENKREYLIESIIPNGSSLEGQTVEQAGLRNMKDVFLAEIYRDSRFITPVKPNEILQSDTLVCSP